PRPDPVMEPATTMLPPLSTATDTGKSSPDARSNRLVQSSSPSLSNLATNAFCVAGAGIGAPQKSKVPEKLPASTTLSSAPIATTGPGEYPASPPPLAHNVRPQPYSAPTRRGL